MSNLFSISFSSVAVPATLPVDLFEITASTRSNLRFIGAAVSRISTAGVGSTLIDLPLIEVLRGATANSGTSTGVIVNVDSRSKATASFLANLPTSNVGAAGSSVHRLFSGVMNANAGTFVWYPADRERPTCKLGERLSIRIGPRANAMSMTGTIWVEEFGKAPGIGDR